MAKKNWLNEILGGQMLLRSGILQHPGFVLYLFLLIALYISINFGIERTLLKERRNERELKHLKSDFISKSARLQYMSKPIEIEKRLKELGSTLLPPVDPPVRVIMEGRRDGFTN